ncbi:hypothetical protein ANCCAN_28625 [Ancylostoma caninum]|uniref:Uncharacterized protein n=1 Tax=Ancylostoma caninum TaxID=29170 RepID=A0A368F0Q8_ANCCA|nr:hypothetical protein ANCCAN_28625 [Ancylostoma caninum]
MFRQRSQHLIHPGKTSLPGLLLSAIRQHPIPLRLRGTFQLQYATSARLGNEAELERAGFDPLEGSSIRYPANEYLRQYEMDIVKSCVAVNSTISLPLAVSADHICAVVIVNFLRLVL